MAMDGKTLNGYLERGLGGKTQISHLTIHNYSVELEKPSNPENARGVEDSVMEQVHGIDATWNKQTRTLTISAKEEGPGFWIPYLGNGIPGIGTEKRGLGTYTPVVAAGISWVATGPFSGCHAYVFPGPIFAHVITPAAGYTAASVATQLEDIRTAANCGPHKSGGAVSGPGFGYVFWTHLTQGWYQRTVYIGGSSSGKVISVTTKALVA